MTSPRERVERALLLGASRLPEPVQRRLAGRPLVLDGLTLAPETQLMLRLQVLSRLPGPETLPLPEGRRAIDHQARLVGGNQPIGSVRDLTAAGRPARLYVPSGAPAVTPLLMFIHGGGFVFGGLDSHDAPCRFLAERSGVRILAIDYRLAPEDIFPAAYDDSVAAYRWTVDHAAELGADPTRIGVGGDSAGGNLSAAVAITAAETGLPCRLQLLIYPGVLAERDTLSSRLFGKGLYLTDEFLDLATRSYGGGVTDILDPHYAPAHADLSTLRDLAPAYVVTAGFDPLRDEGEAYARALAAAGVPVEKLRAHDQIHGFLNLVGVGPRARAANAQIAEALGRLLR